MVVQVTDDDGDSSTDTATVTVTDPSAEQPYASSDPPMPIADFHPKKGPGVTESVITPDGPVQAVAVEVTLTHEAVAELTMSLVSPTGDSVPFAPVVSGETVRYDLDLPEPETGAWTLRIEDSAKGNRGTLESWTLFVAAEAGGAAAASAPIAADSFFFDLGEGSEEDREDVLEPEIAELLLYDR